MESQQQGGETVTDSDTELQARVAWYYFVGGLTQQDIANRLGTSRVRVNRLLAASRESGQVEVTINSDLAGCVALEHELINRFDLLDAVVVPTPDDPALLRPALGVAAASHMASLVTDGMTIALAWGRTIESVMQALPARPGRGISVVGVQGGLAHCGSLNTFEVVSDLARLYDAEQHFFAAPMYANSAEDRERLMAQNSIRDACLKASNADLILYTAGGIEDSLAVNVGVGESHVVDELRANGAVGDVLGYFVDAQGQPIAHPINERCLAIPLSALARGKRVMLIGGGPDRVAITKAALTGGLSNMLVTDERSARAMVTDDTPA